MFNRGGCTSQPQGVVSVNYNNPITKGLDVLVSGIHTIIGKNNLYGHPVTDVYPDLFFDAPPILGTSGFGLDPVNQSYILSGLDTTPSYNLYPNIANGFTVTLVINRLQNSFADDGLFLMYEITGQMLYDLKYTSQSRFVVISTITSLSPGYQEVISPVIDFKGGVVTFRKDATTLSIWVNGVLLVSTTQTVFPTILNNLYFQQDVTGSISGTLSVAYSAFHGRALSNSEIRSLSQNPWQVFKNNSKRISYIPPVPVNYGMGSAITDHGTGLGTHESSITIPTPGIKVGAKIDTFSTIEDATSDHPILDHGYYGCLAGRVAEVSYANFGLSPKTKTSKARSTQPQGRLVLDKTSPLSKGIGFLICGRNHYINNTFGGAFAFPESSVSYNPPQPYGISNKTIGGGTGVTSCTLSAATTFTIFTRYHAGGSGESGSCDVFRCIQGSIYIGISLDNSANTWAVYFESAGGFGWTGQIPNTPNSDMTIAVVYRPDLTLVYVNGVNYGTYAATSLGTVFTSYWNYWYYYGSQDRSPTITGLYHRELNPLEIVELHDNPYQIFEEGQPRILPATNPLVPVGIKVTSTSIHKLTGKFKGRYVWVN